VAPLIPDDCRTGTAQSPLLSIIVDNYNYGQFLHGAIESALNQTYRPLQVIVVDDGSTDNSRAVIAEFDQRIVPVLKPNGGQASAFNAGLEQCRGDIVIFLDSDDLLAANIGEKAVAAFQAQPNSAKVEFRMEVIDALGTPTGAIKPPPHLRLSEGNLVPSVLAFPFDLTWMATSGNAFSARALRQILPVPESEFPILADFYLAHLTALLGPVVALDDIGARYRVHGSNAFEPAQPAVDLDHVRQVMTFAARTRAYILRYAQQLGLADEALALGGNLSVSEVAARLISFKLDPARHPFEADSIGGLLRLGLQASFRRFDISRARRMLQALWFVMMAAAPLAQAGWLAERFYFPETRGRFNAFLHVFHARP
jgi:glycosyltransferase involved in cell wall biosynthesis